MVSELGEAGEVGEAEEVRPGPALRDPELGLGPRYAGRPVSKAAAFPSRKPSLWHQTASASLSHSHLSRGEWRGRGGGGG